jgi:D-alanine-D-alanine ligase-like ATP-grasp enzyme
MKVLILSKKTNTIYDMSLEIERFSRMIKALKKGGVKASHICVNTIEDLQKSLDQIKPDLVFSAVYAVKNTNNDQFVVHEMLEQHNIPYVGSSGFALSRVLDKPVLKEYWKTAGILTPQYFVVKKSADGGIIGTEVAARAKDFPYILKPSKEGNSRGLSQSSIVFDIHSLMEQLWALFSTYDEILVEKYLGQDKFIREFTIAMIGNNNQKLILPREIILKKQTGYRIITTKDKDEHLTAELPVKDPVLKKELVSLANRAFEIAEVRDYARLDVLLSDNHLYAIEINGQPMVPDLWFEACAKQAQLDSEQYIIAIFLAAIVRLIEDGFTNLFIPQEMSNILPPDVFSVLVNNSINMAITNQ